MPSGSNSGPGSNSRRLAGLCGDGLNSGCFAALCVMTTVMVSIRDSQWDDLQKTEQCSLNCTDLFQLESQKPFVVCKC